MKIYRKVCIISLCMLLTPLLVSAQKKKKDFGKMSGSVETNMGYYLKDLNLGIEKVDDAFAINTYVMLGYSINNFRLGLQYELYEPPLLGYFQELKGNKLIQGFVEYQHQKIDIRLGSMYEQFGSGLVFRAYEDRAMGLNNSLLGTNIHWTPFQNLTFKVFAGAPRKYLDYTDSWVYGVDAEMNVLELMGYSGSTYVSIGGSWVLRDDKTDERINYSPAAVRLYAGRINLTNGFFSLGAEYVSKSNSLFYDAQRGFLKKTGSALLVNMGMDFSGIGFALEMRRLENMEFRVDDRTDMGSVNLNYLPSLTKQHKYQLNSLFPHQVKGIGEIGGQFDLFGEIPLDCLEENPIHFSVNASMFRKLKQKGDDYEFASLDGDLLFAEYGLELSRSWGKKFKSILSFVNQEKTEFSAYGFGQMTMNSQIFVGDFLYKFTPKMSLRTELQHIWSDSKDDQRWAMGLLEFAFAPHWMIFASDLYNYESVRKSVHYYSVGGSFVWEKFRASLNYGRNRAGMQCSGGVCRYVPEYSGLNMLLTLTF